MGNKNPFLILLHVQGCFGRSNLIEKDEISPFHSECQFSKSEFGLHRLALRKSYLCRLYRVSCGLTPRNPSHPPLKLRGNRGAHKRGSATRTIAGRASLHIRLKALRVSA
jgi:hypothetical protein